MKILCIDGGGIRGVFAVAILQAIEKEYKQPISNLFDMLAGTSTGSIVAASAVVNIDMEDVQDSYIKYGGKIFKKQSPFGFLKSVYSDRYLRHYIQEAFGDITLHDIEKPLLIPTVDVTHGNPFVHRTNYGEAKKQNDHSIKLWDAVLSSCSAPVFFPPNNVNNHYLAIDGGLWANNPSLVCITEAQNHFEMDLASIQIMSIGTGLQRIDFSIETKKEWGVNKWLPFHLPSMRMKPKLLDLALHLSSESVTYHCQHLLKENYLRINEDLGQEVPFDAPEYVEFLIELGNQTYQKHKDEIASFLNKEISS
ncbi:CBASS cGAMP-activated phospholipase [Bacillus sinesaloumensis]|uniref:CBASS cGAMP-activated phospholipase n=1 Tax=Litchfieldia sinesaloumensis TaxID=1926280 RepID=UPI00098892C2|nr:CBASS cGAMP-activated phospholipase [Bacillus sinesaloumensis]